MMWYTVYCNHMFEDMRMRPIVIGKVEMVDIMEVFCIPLLAIYGYIVSFV